MTTYKTLEDARRGVPCKVIAIIEIDHKTEGRCFVGCLTTADGLKRSLKQSRQPSDIVKVICGHSVKTPEQIETERRADLHDHTSCERCGCKIDGNVAHHQSEWRHLGGSRVQVTAYYCDPCRRVLQAVGQGELSAMEARACEIPSREPQHKPD